MSVLPIKCMLNSLLGDIDLNTSGDFRRTGTGGGPRMRMQSADKMPWDNEDAVQEMYVCYGIVCIFCIFCIVKHCALHY